MATPSGLEGITIVLLLCVFVFFVGWNALGPVYTIDKTIDQVS